MASKDFLLDKRIVQRSIDKGHVEAKAYDQYLSALPDMAGNAAAADVASDDDDDIDDIDDEDEGEED